MKIGDVGPTRAALMVIRMHPYRTSIIPKTPPKTPWYRLLYAQIVRNVYYKLYLRRRKFAYLQVVRELEDVPYYLDKVNREEIFANGTATHIIGEDTYAQGNGATHITGSENFAEGMFIESINAPAIASVFANRDATATGTHAYCGVGHKKDNEDEE